MAEHDYQAVSEALCKGLRLRSDPLALKLFESHEAMNAVTGLRRPKPGVRFSMCQLIGQARWLGWTLGATHDNVVADSNCGGVMGLNAPGEKYIDGRMFHNVWFATVEGARKHQAQMPRVEAKGYVGLVASPLRASRLDPPDICLFYANPAQMILFINGLQWKNYKRFDFSITGESACADSWGNALKTRKASLSIPCFAERRYGGVADDEMLMACPPEDFVKAVEGLHGLAKAGLRYPIMPFSAQVEPAEGMAKSYSGKS